MIKMNTSMMVFVLEGASSNTYDMRLMTKKDLSSVYKLQIIMMMVFVLEGASSNTYDMRQKKET